MDTRFLATLLTVVETGSLVEAARVGGLTAAAVGQRIRKLERQIGCPLFERVGVNIRPTKSCELLYPHIRGLVEDAKRLTDHLDETGLSGTLRVGAISTIVAGLIPSVLQSIRRAHPAVHLRIVPSGSAQIYDRLIEGQHDVAIIVRPKFEPPKSRRIVPLLEEPYVAINRVPIETGIPEALATIEYIRYDIQSWGGENAEAYIKSQGVVPNLLCDLDSLETIASMVGSGAGMSIVPRWIGLNRHADKLWISDPISECASRQICILYNIPTRHPKIIDIFVQVLTDECAKIKKDYCSVDKDYLVAREESDNTRSGRLIGM